MSLLLSASGNLSNNPQNEVGAYQITTMSDSGILYRLDTRTGDIVRIKKSNIPKVDLYKK